MLAEMPKNPGKLNNSSRSHDATTTKTLSELGINKTQSSRWQKLAAVSDDQFEQAITAAKEVAGEVTTAAMLRMEKSNRDKSDHPTSKNNKDKKQGLNKTEFKEYEGVEPEEYDEKEQTIPEGF